MTLLYTWIAKLISCAQRSSVDLLLRVKDVKTRGTLLVEDLHQLAALAESFTEQRPRSNKSWIHLAEALDREGQYVFILYSGRTMTPLRVPGVNLWNTSSLIRESPQGDDRTVVAACK